MGNIAKAIQDSNKSMGQREPSGADAARYVETGDPAALKRIKPVPTQWLNWVWSARRAMGPADKMTEEDRRSVHALAASGQLVEIAQWLSPALAREKPGDDLHAVVRAELAAAGMSAPRIAGLTAAHIMLEHTGRPTSAGRYLLGLSDKDLAEAVKQGAKIHGFIVTEVPYITLTELLLEHAPERLPPLIDLILTPKHMTPRVCELLLEKDPARYEELIASKCREMKDSPDKLAVMKLLCLHDRAKYNTEVKVLARALLGKGEKYAHADIMVWMIEQFGAEVSGDLVSYLETTREAHWFTSRVLPVAVKVLGTGAVPALLAAIRGKSQPTRLDALDHLIKLDPDTNAELIRSEIDKGLNDSQPDVILSCLKLAERGFTATLQERIWPLLGHKSRPVRLAAARALGRLGDAATDRAAALLEDRKADVRASAVALLSAAGTPKALGVLEARLDLEANDDVRDAMLMTLDAARAAEGREVSRKEVEERIARAASKLASPVVDWLDESRLPSLWYRDGDPLDAQGVRYLLYRQSRAKEMRPDVEARPLYALIDRERSGDFALEVLKQFARTKAAPADRWALAIAGLLGDDRAVPALNRLVHEWAESSRGKMAEYAVQALALLGTDAALTTLDAVSIRYRTKLKNIGQAAVEAFAAAAERLGITPDELGDRVVPWLGFEPGRPRVVDCGGRAFEVAIGPDFKLKYRDVAKNKGATSLPKSAPKEVLDEFKGLAATLREVSKAQILRLENLMVRQFRWPAERWSELFLAHPLLMPFASRLVWGAYDSVGTLVGTFRTLDDRTLTDASDEEFRLPPSSQVGMVHPLELDEEARSAWLTHLADYEVVPPFSQMERPVVHVRDDQRAVRMSRDLDGTTLNAMTFKGRAEKLGWTRGSVADAGSVDAYRKSFAAAGVEAFLDLEGMFVGIGMDESVTLRAHYFVKAGAVQIGSYLYDNPSDENDQRIIPFGEVPPVVFSEVLGDLKRIAGKAAEEVEE